jgi:hypothetical protein
MVERGGIEPQPHRGPEFVGPAAIIFRFTAVATLMPLSHPISSFIL